MHPKNILNLADWERDIARFLPRTHKECFKFARPTHLTLDSSEDKWFHDEFGLRNTIPLKAALLLMGFLIYNKMFQFDQMKHTNNYTIIIH